MRGGLGVRVKAYECVGHVCGYVCVCFFLVERSVLARLLKVRWSIDLGMVYGVEWSL
jgi:hypothetical protein